MILIAVPIASLGLAGTGDLCGDPVRVGDHWLTATGFDDKIAYVWTTCHYAGRQLEVERNVFNWVGMIAALSFLVGAFFAMAGLLRLVPAYRAAVVTAVCVLVCMSMVVVFFA